MNKNLEQIFDGTKRTIQKLKLPFIGGVIGSMLLFSSCTKGTDSSKFLIKLPDGGVRIDYEKLTNHSPRTDYSGKTISWYMGEYDEFKETAFKLREGERERSNIKLTSILIPNNEVKEAFIVPRMRDDKSFLIYIFIDKECYKNFKEIELAFLTGIGKSSYLGKLSFKEKQGVYFTHVDKFEKYRDYNAGTFIMGDLQQKTFNEKLNEDEIMNIIYNGDYIAFGSL